MIDEEKMSVFLYRVYHIAEWFEKSCILTTEERIEILNDLKNGENSDLVRLARLPFPAFAEAYFKNFKQYDRYFSDPSFAYKLYFLNQQDLRYFTEKLRSPDKSRSTIIEEFSLPKKVFTRRSCTILMETDLENLPKIMSASSRKRDYEIKFAYLTQYIDLKEAQRLKLKVAETFIQDGIDGYDLEGKLSILNPAARTIMTYYLGLYGLKRHPKYVIHKVINLDENNKTDRSPTIIKDTVELLFPYFSKTLGEFKNFLGYIDERQIPGNMFEYGKRSIRNFDINLQLRHIYYALPESDRTALSSRNINERNIYLAAKYMFKTPESLARNLVITLPEAKKMLMTIRQGKE